MSQGMFVRAIFAVEFEKQCQALCFWGLTIGRQTSKHSRSKYGKADILGSFVMVRGSVHSVSI